MKTGDDTAELPLYDAILDDIYDGRLAGGQRLKVSEIAERYGTSTSPVREVLRRMQGEGFVEIHPNRGATIRPTDAGSIQNIFEVLQMLEPYFVNWFADYAPPDLLDELEGIQARIHELPHSPSSGPFASSTFSSTRFSAGGITTRQRPRSGATCAPRSTSRRPGCGFHRRGSRRSRRNMTN